MKKGDIIFVQGKGIISKIIRYFDKGKYSHVAIVMNEYYVLESDVFKNVDIRPFDKDKYSLITVVDLGLTEKQKEIACEVAKKYKGIKYDYTQLLWYVFKKIFKLKGRNKLNNPNNMICSELVWNILDELDILKELGLNSNINGIDLTPNELFDLVNYVAKDVYDIV